MILDSEAIESVMVWARQQAPYIGNQSKDYTITQCLPRRRVRVEIAAEQLGDTCHEKLMCRVYLAEPRCYHGAASFLNICECKPLTETRLI